MARTFRHSPTLCDPDAVKDKAHEDRKRRDARKRAQFVTPLRVAQVMHDVRTSRVTHPTRDE